MNEVDKLKGLLTFVQQIANQKGNEWMWDDIYELIDGKSNLSIIDDHPKLKLIYEQNILKVASKHADLFYKDFSIESIIPQLKSDFIKMDYAMRKGDLGLFAIHCYQQVEGITNFIHNTKVIPNWENEKNQYVEFDKQNDKYPPKSLENFFFPWVTNEDGTKKQDKTWYASKKFDVVYYFSFAKGKHYSNLQKGREFFNKINTLRNWGAHRGSIEKDYQKEQVNQASANPTLFYAQMIQGLHAYLQGFRKINN